MESLLKAIHHIIVRITITLTFSRKPSIYLKPNEDQIFACKFTSVSPVDIPAS